MMSTSALERVVAAWEDVLLTTPDPLRSSGQWLLGRLGGPRLSYRELLDQREVNTYGDIIPRIERVKRHILLLGDPHLPASRLPR